MNDDYNILKEWGIVKSENIDIAKTVSTPKSTSSSNLAFLQSQNKILKYKLTPEQCIATPKSRSQSSTPRSCKSITKSLQNTPKRILHYQLTPQQCKKLNEKSDPSTPSKSSTKINKTQNIENNKPIDNHIISSKCSERRYEYSYPYLTEYQPFVKDDIKIARCVSGTRDALLLADYLRIMSPKKKAVYDYSVKPCDNNKPIPKYTGNVKILSPTKSREFYQTTNATYGET